MPQSLLLVLAAYVFLVALALSVLVRSTLPVTARAALVVLAGVFFLSGYDALRASLGWPAQDTLPERFMLVSAWVAEPDRKDDTEGAISLWLVELEDERPGPIPRSFRLPYDEDLHAQLTEAEHRMKQGKMQIGRRLSEDEGMPFSGNQQASAKLEIEFYDLPDPSLPEK